jgi:hypothetical protein
MPLSPPEAAAFDQLHRQRMRRKRRHIQFRIFGRGRKVALMSARPAVRHLKAENGLATDMDALFRNEINVTPNR